MGLCKLAITRLEGRVGRKLSMTRLLLPPNRKKHQQLPLLESGGKFFQEINKNREANEAPYHAHW